MKKSKIKNHTNYNKILCSLLYLVEVPRGSLVLNYFRQTIFLPSQRDCRFCHFLWLIINNNIIASSKYKVKQFILFSLFFYSTQLFIQPIFSSNNEENFFERCLEALGLRAWQSGKVWKFALFKSPFKKGVLHAFRCYRFKKNRLKNSFLKRKLE